MLILRESRNSMLHSKTRTQVCKSCLKINCKLSVHGKSERQLRGKEELKREDSERNSKRKKN